MSKHSALRPFAAFALGALATSLYFTGGGAPQDLQTASLNTALEVQAGVVPLPQPVKDSGILDRLNMIDKKLEACISSKSATSGTSVSGMVRPGGVQVGSETSTTSVTGSGVVKVWGSQSPESSEGFSPETFKPKTEGFMPETFKPTSEGFAPETFKPRSSLFTPKMVAPSVDSMKTDTQKFEPESF